MKGTKRNILIAPDGSTIEVIQLTKELCEKMLSKIPDFQRNSKSSNLEKIKSAIDGGDWIFNGVPILFSKEGWLVDGVHRLKKFLSEKFFPSVVVIHLTSTAKEVYPTIDKGASRSLGDTFKSEGIKQYNNMATLSQACVNLNRYNDPKRTGVNEQACLDFYYKNEELLIKCQKSGYMLQDLVTLSIASTCCYKLDQCGYDFEEYVNSLASMTNLSQAQSNYCKILIKDIKKPSGKMSPQDHYKTFLFHFKSHVDGTKGSQVQYNKFMKTKNTADAFRMIKPNTSIHQNILQLD